MQRLAALRVITFAVTLIFVWSVSFAVSVTFELPVLQKGYGDELVEAPVDRVLKDASRYFTEAEVANLYPYDFNGDVAIVFGGDVFNSTYPVGKLRLTLSDWFKSKTIVSVSVDAELYNEYVYGQPSMAVYLYVNGTRSGSSIFANSSSQKMRAELTCELYDQCETLEICMAANIKKTTADSKSIVRSITIEYEGEDVEPIEIDPANGIQDLAPGQTVSLSGCVIEQNSGEYIAHVVKVDGNGNPVIQDGTLATYTIPVVWKGEPQTQACLDISGTIVEISGKKYVEVDHVEAVSPTCSHAPAAIHVNGEPLGEQLIAASDIISLDHPLGEGVIIYYTKRKGVTLDPQNATVDPAIVTAPKVHKAPVTDTPDENGTYIYTAPFKLVHPANLGDVNQNDITLRVQAHSSPALTAGAAIQPSEVTTPGNPITTGTITIQAPENETTRYYNLQGLPEENPRPGQLLIRQSTTTSTQTIIFSK